MPEPKTPIAELERRIARGDEQAMREYTEDAFLNQRNNEKELRRRVLVLLEITLEPRTVTPFVCLAKLTALVDDVEAWSTFAGKIEDIEPGVGYFTWRALKRHTKNDELCDKWLFAVERSAENGHIPSRFLLCRLEYNSAPFYKRPFIRVKLGGIEVDRRDIVAKNPKDRRLVE